MSQKHFKNNLPSPILSPMGRGKKREFISFSPKGRRLARRTTLEGRDEGDFLNKNNELRWILFKNSTLVCPSLSFTFFLSLLYNFNEEKLLIFKR